MVKNEVTLEMSVIYTITYADLFDYPLTSEEIYHFVNLKCTISELKQKLDDLIAIGKLKVQHHDSIGYYMLPQQDLREIRYLRERVSAYFWKIVGDVVPLLKRVPFLRSVMISGDLAMNNSEMSSDIDFMILVDSRRTWIVRLLLFFYEYYLERVRYPGVDFCFNYIMSSAEMKLSQKINVAREVVQMKVIYDTGLYAKFITQNKWIMNYYPNLSLATFLSNIKAIAPQIQAKPKRKNSNKILKTMSQILLSMLSGFLDKFNILEMRRAMKSINKLSAGNETYFSIEIYKGHFSSNFNKIDKLLKSKERVILMQDQLDL